MIPNDMVLVRTADLAELLDVAIARGAELPRRILDTHYRQWLAEIRASMAASDLTSVPADAAALPAADGRAGFRTGHRKGGTAEHGR